jgi:hypothetical protein
VRCLQPPRWNFDCSAVHDRVGGSPPIAKSGRRRSPWQGCCDSASFASSCQVGLASLQGHSLISLAHPYGVLHKAERECVPRIHNTEPLRPPFGLLRCALRVHEHLREFLETDAGVWQSAQHGRGKPSLRRGRTPCQHSHRVPEVSTPPMAGLFSISARAVCFRSTRLARSFSNFWRKACRKRTSLKNSSNDSASPPNLPDGISPIFVPLSRITLFS